jgi:hypothetical protein
MMTRLGRANHQPQPPFGGPRESCARPGAASFEWRSTMTTHQGVTYYCPACWVDIEVGSRFCPHCHIDLAALDQRTWRRKLLGALSHPEPTTRQRAAFILGQLRDEDAVDTLARLLTSSTDHFFCAEIVGALGKIGGVAAEQSLRRALDHASFLVREMALVALVRRGGAVAEAALNHAQQDPSPSVQRLVGEYRNGTGNGLSEGSVKDCCEAKRSA